MKIDFKQELKDPQGNYLILPGYVGNPTLSTICAGLADIPVPGLTPDQQDKLIGVCDRIMEIGENGDGELEVSLTEASLLQQAVGRILIPRVSRLVHKLIEEAASGERTSQ